MKHIITVSAALILAATPMRAEPAKYATPDAAVDAVMAALKARDRDALLTVFGPENEDVAFTGDSERDLEIWTGFIREYRRRHSIEMEGPDRAILHIGREDWPFPAPIVKTSGTWSFDGAAAREEVQMRRIGINELDVIDLMHRAVTVQSVYRQTDHDGDGVMEFASSILSTPGRRDGLYWPSEAGTEESPIGAFLARASDSGFSIDGTDQEPDPYLGYYFRILQKQGGGAPGGALDYIVNGNMIAGHALLAYPAAYGETGIMTFIVGENGIVYEKDLGADTLPAAEAIDSYDPGEGWVPAE
ncbi:DUF2950 domain-containing protein [Tabrizicola sp. J26]|uniref:DUF2950 domain-containing protein n=1 Tax=Alitabrizicola rongguiensis TaxID=2909234 RepID=UPI001F2482BB|nr:DUF2950 domain-containing protein [Tabrizicola rongguiensis]MCF1710636.1 DUF2950 domain-containing protein [Tabrizicola rongguiensis]